MIEHYWLRFATTIRAPSLKALPWVVLKVLLQAQCMCRTYTSLSPGVTLLIRHDRQRYSKNPALCMYVHKIRGLLAC